MANTFTFDSAMESAFTRDIGLKTQAEIERKSIWDIDLGDEMQD